MEEPMKATFLTCCVLAAVLFGMAAPPAAAQDEPEGDERAGTAAAPYLLIPLSARTAALGTALTGGMSNLSAVEALQANPAAMMSNEGTSAQFSRMEYVADIGVNYIGIAQRFGSNSIALTASAWDYGEIAEQSETSPDITDVTYDASSTVVGLSLARQFTDRIAAGFTVKALSESIDDMNASAVAFDAGMTYVVGESGLRFGVSLKNFGTSMNYGGTGLATVSNPDPNDDGGVSSQIESLDSELPSLLNFGVSYTRMLAGDLSVTALGNFRSVAYDQDEYSAGLEAGYMNLFYVRGGVLMTQDMDASFYQGWNAGAGLNLDVSGFGLSVDYAYRATDFFDGVNMFTVSLGL
jgi:hypothetical protein